MKRIRPLNWSWSDMADGLLHVKVNTTVGKEANCVIDVPALPYVFVCADLDDTMGRLEVLMWIPPETGYFAMEMADLFAGAQRLDRGRRLAVQNVTEGPAWLDYRKEPSFWVELLIDFLKARTKRKIMSEDKEKQVRWMWREMTAQPLETTDFGTIGYIDQDMLDGQPVRTICYQASRVLG